jgi:hypothetical protein
MALLCLKNVANIRMHRCFVFVKAFTSAIVGLLLKLVRLVYRCGAIWSSWASRLAIHVIDLLAESLRGILSVVVFDL